MPANVTRALGWRTRRAFALVALLLPLLVPTAQADETQAAGGAKNVVIAINHTDGALRSASRVAVSMTATPHVGTENLALAQATCNDCRTVAVAMQVVPIMRDAHVIVPMNAAVAVNGGCNTCRTAAFAYQFVFTTGGIVHLSEEGRRQVSEIRTEAGALAASELPFFVLEEQLDALAARLKAVVDAELVPAGATAELHKHVERVDGGS